jgi:anti-anti-sigma factor
MKLSLVSIEKACCVNLAVEGDITNRDFLNAKGSDLFEKLLGASWASNNILLNLANSTYMDSAAIGWLIESHHSVQSAGGKFVLHSAQQRIVDILDLLKLRLVLNIKDNETSARQFVAARAAKRDPRSQATDG